jgi:glutathione S-transferase
VLNEIGQPFELRRFGTSEHAHRSAEYLAINSKGYIPALQIDGFTLTENSAILAFLGRRFSEAGLYPAGGEPEARCLEWLAWNSNTLHVAFAQVRRTERFTESEGGKRYVVASGRSNVRRGLDIIEAHLAAHDWAVPRRYSVVDPYWLVFYRWGHRIGMNMAAAYPSYTRYVERLGERAAVKKSLAAEGLQLKG